MEEEEDESKLVFKGGEEEGAKKSHVMRVKVLAVHECQMFHVSISKWNDMFHLETNTERAFKS